MVVLLRRRGEKSSARLLLTLYSRLSHSFVIAELKEAFKRLSQPFKFKSDKKMRFEQSLAKVYILSYSSLYISGMSHIVNESDMDGVIMVSAAQMSHGLNIEVIVKIECDRYSR